MTSGENKLQNDFICFCLKEKKVRAISNACTNVCLSRQSKAERIYTKHLVPLGE